MASGGIFFFNLDDHLVIGTSNCWAFPALEKEIDLVLLNQKDGIDVIFWIMELEHPVFIGGAIFIMGKQILPHINYMRLFHY